jgi:hypothetical protein
METSSASWTPRERALLVLCLVTLGVAIAGNFDFGGTAGGAPGRGSGVGSSVTSGEIVNGTIRGRDIGPTITSADIVNGSIRASDLGIYQSGSSFEDLPADPGSVADVFATCDPGDVAISGGFVTDPTRVVVQRFENFYLPRGPSWYVAGTRVGQPGPTSITAEAVCLNDN